MALAVALTAPSLAHAGRGPALRSVRVDAPSSERLPSSLSAACAQTVRDELRAGQRRNAACAQDREAAGRAVVRRRDAFGFVERRQVDLASLRLVLGVGKRCRRWPLRSPEHDVLRRTDVDEAGCRLRRYPGDVTVVLVDHQGRRHTPLPAVRADTDGRVELHFAELDHALRALHRGQLSDYARIELGDDAWAGHVDLDRLLRFRADWHLTWVGQGRGVPGLFAAGHPEHPGANEARTMAADAALARQQHDYARVQAGELTTRAFLDRHPWSPYRRQVESWGPMPRGDAGRGTPDAARAEPARARDGRVEGPADATAEPDPADAPVEPAGEPALGHEATAAAPSPVVVTAASS